MKTQFLLGLLGTVSCAPSKAARGSVAVDYNAAAPYVFPLRQETVKFEASSTLLPSRLSLANLAGPPKNPGEADLTNHEWIFYIIDVIVGNQTIPLQLDTGSADTWMVQDPLTCITETMLGGQQVAPTMSCGFGPGFKGNLSQGVVKNQTFYRKYSDHTFARGFYGFEDVTIGGITAKHQQLGIVNYSEWFGDHKTSGILGLAYPLMTGLNNEGQLDPLVPEYDPVFTTMWKQNLTLPMFSLALSRDKTGKNRADDSYLAFGGIPPVNYDDSGWARTPIQPLHTIPGWDSIASKDRGLYLITPDAIVYGNKNATTKEPKMTTDTYPNPFLIDAGSTLTVLPTDMFQKIKYQFEPAPDWRGSGRSYYVECNASIPTVGIQIGSSVFYMDPEDLVRQESRDETGTLCRVGLDEGYDPPYMLGVSFLNNVVAVFDVGNNEMRFAPRKRDSRP